MRLLGRVEQGKQLTGQRATVGLTTVETGVDGRTPNVCLNTYLYAACRLCSKRGVGQVGLRFLRHGSSRIFYLFITQDIISKRSSSKCRTDALLASGIDWFHPGPAQHAFLMNPQMTAPTIMTIKRAVCSVGCDRFIEGGGW